MQTFKNVIDEEVNPTENEEQLDEKDEEVVEENMETVLEDEIDPQEPKEYTEKDEESVADQYVRLMADFQNYKKRTEKQKSEIYAFANEKIVAKLLDVMDNFERALQVDDENIASFKEGMELIFKQLKDVLSGAGVAEIETENVPFDPNFHNAVLMEETDAVESGHVCQVLQKGYTLNGKVVRPAMVKVAQ